VSFSYVDNRTNRDSWREVHSANCMKGCHMTSLSFLLLFWWII